MIAVVKDIGPVIRDMQHSDVSVITEIETRTYPYPWSATIFRDCLLAGYTSAVLERAGEIVGYAIMSVAAAEAHLLNLCVTPDFRRSGLGKTLLEFLLDQARALGAERIYLEVRPTNQAALGLYHNAGFVELGLRKGYYRAEMGREDAVVLVRRLALKRD